MAIQTSLATPVDIVNAALRQIGHPDRIGDFFDGTQISGVALSVYGQERDSLMREFDPGFAQKSANLVMIKQAPAGGYVPGVVNWDPVTNPPVQWLYEYAYPEDCLRLRAVLGQRFFQINFAPQPTYFQDFFDETLTPPAKAIACNIPDAMIVYTARVTNPTLWEASFTQTLVERLAKSMAGPLTRLAQGAMQSEQLSEAQAGKSQQTDVIWQG